VVLSESAAEQALVNALSEVGVTASAEARVGDHRVDVVADIGGSPVYVEVKTVSTISAGSLPKWLDAPVNGPEQAARVVVADRVLSAARESLRERGWGWLDLRGHLRLSAPGLLIDTDVSRIAPERRTDDPLAGAAGLEAVCAMLLDPEKPISVRGLAREINRSPSTVSAVLDAFRRDHLITRQNDIAVPEMFWAAASAWKPITTEVGPVRPSVIEDPDIATVLRMNWNDPTGTTGWALADTMAAAAYGAPVGTRSEAPPDFYVADIAILRRAETIFGLATTSNARGATIRVAPVPQVCSRRNPPIPNRTHWPLAHPLFVAFDLAKDVTRGREILDGWQPPEGIVRVW
jgi:hypothetical protein